MIGFTRVAAQRSVRSGGWALAVACLTLLLPAANPAAADGAGAPATAPFRYVWGTATHILPETHTDESGYFSLCEGFDGRLYIGTTAYGRNAYLVEYDPATGKQRMVVDTHALCGLTAAGYAAQAKIHTRNFVGPSGVIYFGSQQGYRRGDDTSEYPGGHVMTYDPATGQGRDLGRPIAGQGIIDVVADEPRGRLYVVTCMDQYWLRYDMETGIYHELAPRLTPYATTLVDARGVAHAITADFQLARYHPERDTVTLHPLVRDGQRFERPSNASIPTWNLAADGRTVYLILMNDATLFSLDLMTVDATATLTALGPMVDGRRPDSRAALTIAPDGRVYTLIRIDNTTAFGGGTLHTLNRYSPDDQRFETLGVLAVKNPDFFDFGPGPDGKRPPWTHGYHTLPDGVLTPLHAHMALVATRGGDLYATILYPFTLLHIDGASLP